MKRLIILILCAAIMLGVTACRRSSGDPEDRPRRSGENTTADEQEVTTPPAKATGGAETGSQPPQGLPSLEWSPPVNHPALADVNITQKIKLMSWYDPGEASPEAELYKMRYGVDTIFELNLVTYAKRYERLSAAVASGDSPDMFPFEEQRYPVGITQHANSIFDTIDGIIDLSGAEWDATRDIIELFKWQGSNYVPVTELQNSSSLLFYRRSVAADAGLSDPYDLWMQNKWTWVEFEEMLRRFTDPGSKKWGIMGWYIDDSAILSTGTPLVGLQNGRLVNNLDNRNVERAMGLLERMAQNDYRYPYHIENDNQLDRSRWRKGDILFWVDGMWEYEQFISFSAATDGWNHDEFGVVPWPRDPQSNVHYQRGNHSAMMLVRGAKNIDGYKAWVQCAVIAAQDPDAIRLNRERLITNFGYTEQLLDTLEKIRELTPVWDFKRGISCALSFMYSWCLVENLTKPVIIQGEHTYAQTREENRGPIDARIISINSLYD
jgi:multiple sugar transport system substrate-binding protein